MGTKLTLKLDETVISKAKKYASNHNTSLSRLIENYLETVTNDEVTQDEITPLVKSLSGIVSLSDKFDYKKEYTDFLTEKYK